MMPPEPDISGWSDEEINASYAEWQRSREWCVCNCDRPGDPPDIPHREWCAMTQPDNAQKCTLAG